MYEGESNMNRNSVPNSREVIRSPHPPIIDWVKVDIISSRNPQQHYHYTLENEKPYENLQELPVQF